MRGWPLRRNGLIALCWPFVVVGMVFEGAVMVFDDDGRVVDVVEGYWMLLERY